MKPVFQRVTDHDPINGQIGDCFRAATASILEMNLDEVPHFAALCAPDYEHFWRVVNEWFSSKGMHLKFCAPLVAGGFLPISLIGRHHFVFGSCINRGKLMGHALVGFNGVVVHDPDHTKPKLVNGIEGFGYLVDRDGRLLG